MRPEIQKNRTIFGANLKTLRTRHGLTMVDMAESAGCSRQRINDVESGLRACGPKLAVALAKTLKLKPEKYEQFLVEAAGTTWRGKAADVGVDSKLAASFLEFLRRHKIDPEKIIHAEIEPRRKDHRKSPDLVLTDKLGVSYEVEIKVKRL